MVSSANPRYDVLINSAVDPHVVARSRNLQNLKDVMIRLSQTPSLSKDPDLGTKASLFMAPP